jgi:hypothetical protein
MSKLSDLTTKSKNNIQTFLYKYYSTFKWLLSCKNQINFIIGLVLLFLLILNYVFIHNVS